MRAIFYGFAATALLAGCANAEQTSENTLKVRDLPIVGQLVMSSLAAEASKEGLSNRDLCENSGVCGEDGAIAVKELSSLGLITVAATGDIALTQAGEEFVQRNYRVTRDGDRTTVETRDEAVD